MVTNAQYDGIGQGAITRPEGVPDPGRTCTSQHRPCVAYAAHVIAARDPKAWMIVAPSDHLVLKEDAFQDTVELAVGQATASDCLVTLGIMPNRPDTGYGYIQFKEGDGTAPSTGEEGEDLH